jgi:hypothetical protein
LSIRGSSSAGTSQVVSPRLGFLPLLVSGRFC